MNYKPAYKNTINKGIERYHLLRCLVAGAVITHYTEMHGHTAVTGGASVTFKLMM